MFDLLNKILGNSEKDATNSQKVEDPHIALCVLLLEAAHVDGNCSTEEKQHLIETLTKHYGISPDQIDSLLQKSDDQRKESVDLFRFTRYMNNSFDKEEKIKVMEAVWRIILIDDHLEAHEDHFAHKLSNLLRLTHKELIDAKLKARKQLA